MIKDNSLVLRCETFDPSKIIYIKHKGNILLSYGKKNPVMMQTPYITIRKGTFKNILNNKIRIYCDNRNGIKGINEIFDVFSKLDDYMNVNLDDIMKKNRIIRSNYFNYYPCIRFNKEDNVSYIDFKFEGCGQQIKVYDASGSNYKMYAISELDKIFKLGNSIRFIIGINCLFLSHEFASYSIKIIQIENDFNEGYKGYKGHEGYTEFLQRNIRCGSSKIHKQKFNKRIINMINESTDNYLFNELDEYESNI